MISRTLHQFKWLGFACLWAAVILAWPLEQGAGAAGKATQSVGDRTKAAAARQADTTAPSGEAGAHSAAGKSGTGGKAMLAQGDAASKKLKLALTGLGAAAEPNIAELEESDLFANLDKWLDRFETVEVMATGYSAGKESTGKTPGHPQYGITYSGVKVRKDKFSTIAADPSVFPLGTVLYIPGYGFGVVADTGSKIKGHKIDLYFKTKNQVYQQWGKKTVRVHVLIRGDGKVTEAMMDRLNALQTVPVEQVERAPAQPQ